MTQPYETVIVNIWSCMLFTKLTRLVTFIKFLPMTKLDAYIPLQTNSLITEVVEQLKYAIGQLTAFSVKRL